MIVGGVESSTMTTTDEDEMLFEESVAVTESVFVAFCVRFTDIEKLPPVAVPVAVVAPPSILTRESVSALPVMVMESALIVVDVVVRIGAEGGVVSTTSTILVTEVALFPEASVAL